MQSNKKNTNLSAKAAGGMRQVGRVGLLVFSGPVSTQGSSDGPRDPCLPGSEVNASAASKGLLLFQSTTLQEGYAVLTQQNPTSKPHSNHLRWRHLAAPPGSTLEPNPTRHHHPARFCPATFLGLGRLSEGTAFSPLKGALIAITVPSSPPAHRHTPYPVCTLP